MEHLLAPFKWIDGKIQAVVDAAAFFFMRRGVKKSFLVYGVYAVIIILCVVLMWYEFVLRNLGGIFIYAYLTFILFQAQKNIRKNIEQSESAGVLRSIPDKFVKSLCVLRFIFAFLLIVDIVSLFVKTFFTRPTLSHQVYGIVFDLFNFLLLYLLMTPNLPPPKKKEVKVKQSDLVYQSI